MIDQPLPTEELVSTYSTLLQHMDWTGCYSDDASIRREYDESYRAIIFERRSILMRYPELEPELNELDRKYKPILSA